MNTNLSWMSVGRKQVASDNKMTLGFFMDSVSPDVDVNKEWTRVLNVAQFV